MSMRDNLSAASGDRSGFQIQMRDNGRWHTLGGYYTAEDADVRVLQFMEAYTCGSGTSRICKREFRIRRAS